MVTMIDTLATRILAMAPDTASGQGPARAPFEARTATLTGTIVLSAPVPEVFPLFSPLGEKGWVEGWNPEILFPRDAEWTEGMIFRTASGDGDEIWVVAELDLHAHLVVYYRTEPGRLVARVEVRCCALDGGRTEATTVYSYVGLSEMGNRVVAEWTNEAYRSKMERWEKNINDYLRRIGT